MQAWARIGAEIRLRELEAEQLAIFRVFPELGVSPDPKAKRPISQESAPSVPRTERKMSTAARRKISEAQKARWAARKAGKTAPH